MKTEIQRQQQLESIVLELNKTGLSFLTFQKFNEAFTYLKQAQKLIERQLIINPSSISLNKFAGITYNNLACYYKKVKKPKISLIYLQKALGVEVYKVEDWTSTASTHLNICAIYSHLKNHEDAAIHAQLSLDMLDKVKPELKKEGTEMGRSFYNLCMLSHYNLAIQLEYLRRFQQSLEEFKMAKKYAKQAGKKNIGIINACDQSIYRIEENLTQLKEKLVKLVTKKRIEEEKGHYSHMRMNKKNFRIRESDTNIGSKLKQFRQYENQPHVRTKSFHGLRIDQNISESREKTHSKPCCFYTEN